GPGAASRAASLHGGAVARAQPRLRPDLRQACRDRRRAAAILRGMNDLTAKARIRDAAMQLFGEVGYERATTRAIAERAGVTSGLIRHHYGSKQRLLAACDEWIIKLIRRLEAQIEADAGLLSPLETIGAYRQYLARALFEGRAAAVFDHMVASTQKPLTIAEHTRRRLPDVPLRARDTVQTAFSLDIGM